MKSKNNNLRLTNAHPITLWSHGHRPHEHASAESLELNLFDF